MEERRQVVRVKPIVIEIEDERTFTARPLSWMEANDYGNEIIRQNTESLNQFVQIYMTDTDIPQLEMKLRQKISDWHALLKIGYPDEPMEKWSEPRPLDVDECVALALAAAEVNHLEHLRALIDPNFQTPMTPGGNNTSDSPGTNGPKTSSTSDSDSSDSVETKLSV